MKTKTKDKKKRKKKIVNHSYGRYGGMLSLYFFSFVFLFSLLSLSQVSHAIVTLNQNQFYDIENNQISNSNNASMDIKCTTVPPPNPANIQGLTPVNRARGMINVSDQSIILNNTIGYAWNQNERLYKAPAYLYFVTNQGNYSRIFSNNVQNTNCQFNAVGEGQSNLSSIPFFAGASYADVANNIYRAQVNGSLGVLFSSIDLGYTVENATNYLFFDPTVYPMGFTFFYDAYDNVLVPINASYDEGAYCPSGTLCNHGLSAGDPNQLKGLQCRFSSTNFTSNLANIKNGQDGTYDYICYNNDGVGSRNTGIGWVVNFTGANNQPLIVFPNTNYNMMFYNYSTYNSITGTTWSPTNPQPAQNVTISFFTALPADTYVFYHYKNVTGNDTYPLSWLSLYNNNTVTSHSIVINSANILDGKIYEFYVQTSTPTAINDTNNSAYYNFVVGAYAGFTNTGASNTIGGAASNLGNTGLCNGSDCLYIVGIVFLIGIGIPAFYYGHTKMAIPIISTAIIIESLVGLLPLYLILPFVIFGLLWLVKKLGIIGGGSSEE